MIRRLVLVLSAALLLPLPCLGQDHQPEGASARQGKAAVTASREMVVSAHPLASRVGADILAAGGSAVDAAIAVQLALTLVEPQSSGIGGGAFLLHWDAATRRIASYDAREKAPAEATPALFLDADGKPMRFFDAVVGGRSVGVPGVPRLLERIHAAHGKLPWAQLFEPVIRLAEEGFPMPARLNALLTQERFLPRDATARAYFYQPDLQPKHTGTPMRNPDLAATLRAIARGGADAFYKGPIAEDIVAAVRREPNPGLLSLADLAAFTVVERDPVCGSYRTMKICSMGPPSSGGVAVLQMLAVLEPFDLKAAGAGTAASAHLLAEAGRLAFADRDLYLADPDQVPQPVAGLLDRSYLAGRSGLISTGRSLGRAAAGSPPQRRGDRLAPGEALELPSTSHVVIVDAAGNAVSMTTTIEDQFGSRRMVRGFLLNNQLTDFSFLPEQDGRPVANRVAPGKRPRSSMAPSLVFDPDGALRLVLGSPGGARIINYVAQALVAVIDWELDLQAALDLGHVVNRNGRTELEQDTAAAALKPALEALGHEVVVMELTSGLHAIAVAPGKLTGAADPRRDGLPVGR